MQERGACLSASEEQPTAAPVFKIGAPVPAGDSATVREFGLRGLNWLPYFADEEVEAWGSFVYPVPCCISSKNLAIYSKHAYCVFTVCLHCLVSCFTSPMREAIMIPFYK